MSDIHLARRTELKVKISGVDVSEDINKYFISAVYTDNEEDKADDIRIELDDREGYWLEWLGKVIETKAEIVPVRNGEFKKGSVIYFKGGTHYYTSMDTSPRGGNRKSGLALLYNTAPKAEHPYSVIGGWGKKLNGVSGDSDVYGWVNESQIEFLNDSNSGSGSGISGSNSNSGSRDIKGFNIYVIIIQKNWESDGKDRVLVCGEFEIDSTNAKGGDSGGSRVTIKGTSLPHKSSTVRTQLKTRAWENIQLSSIAREIAVTNGLTCMYESSFNPVYKRLEQVQWSDIAFLKKLCRNAGISLKVINGIMVLFDCHEFEKKAAVFTIERGKSDVKSYRFGTSMNKTAYARCRVSYTNPSNGETIEYTYTPQDSDSEGLTLEINEKVNNKNEARNLAMKRLREKNKNEYQAEFTLAEDVRYVAGVTVNMKGWGFFDGKYIISQTIRNISGSGGTLQIKLRRVLEEY
jgi:phage protein D